MADVAVVICFPGKIDRCMLGGGYSSVLCARDFRCRRSPSQVVAAVAGRNRA